MRPAIWSFLKNRIAAAGIEQQIAEALPLVEEALRGEVRPVHAAGGHRGPALPGGPSRRHRLASDRAALRSSRTPAALSHRVAKPGRRGRHGGRSSTRAGSHRCSSPRPVTLDDYHLLHAARADLLRRARIRRGSGEELRSERWRWSPTTASADFSNDACAKFNPRQFDLAFFDAIAGGAFR